MSLFKSQYVPGVRNINERESRFRKETGYVAFFSTIAFVSFVHIADGSMWLYLLSAVPLWIFTLSFLQAYNHFCANYGLRGLQNAYRGHDDAERVMSEPARRQDRVRSIKLMTQAGVISILAAVAITVILN